MGESPEEKKENPSGVAGGEGSADLARAGDPSVDPEMRREALLTEAASLPKEPGVYLFRDGRGDILYIGKAKVLRNRVRSYFQRGDDGRYQIRFLVPKIRRIETVVTRTEEEAIFLENTLIKRHRPRYNIELKDDKSYLVIEITTGHPWPRAVATRRPDPESPSKYYGPYGSAMLARETLDVLQRTFALRTCTDAEFDRRTRPCIEYEIGRCTAPCVGLITEKDYAERVRAVQMVLSGRGRTVIGDLTARMEEASEATDYERAAKYRDQVTAVRETIERHPVVSMDLSDRDVVGFHRDGPSGVILLLFVRGGTLLETRAVPVEMHGFTPEERVEQFLARYYGNDNYVPEEILLPFAIEGMDALQSFIAEKRRGKVEVLVPQRGDRAKLVELANRNARESLERQKAEDQKVLEQLERMRERLGLKRLPVRIECYDISHLGGQFTAASRVVFHMGQPVKRFYRKYQIRTVTDGDDFAAMREVLTRRLARAPAPVPPPGGDTTPEGVSAGGAGSDAPVDDEWRLPDLMVVDGGKGQLKELVRAAMSLGILSRPDAPDLASLAKSRVLERDSRGNGPGGKGSGVPVEDAVKHSGERVFRPGEEEPRPLDPHSGEYRILTHLRDESHRFAIRYQRKLREKIRFRSKLDEIEGVGPARRMALLKAFGSLDGVKKASVEELKAVKGVSGGLAEKIHRFFNPKAD